MTNDTTKTADAPPSTNVPCTNPAHSPPTLGTYRPGAHQYICPTCKHVTTFTVDPAFCVGKGT